MTEEVGVLQAGCCGAGWLGGSAATAAAPNHGLVCTKPCWQLAVLDPASVLFALPPALPQKYGATPETQAASSSGADTEATFDPNADRHKVGAGMPWAVCLPLSALPSAWPHQSWRHPARPACPAGPFVTRRIPPVTSTPLAPLFVRPCRASSRCANCTTRAAAR